MASQSTQKPIPVRKNVSRAYAGLDGPITAADAEAAERLDFDRPGRVPDVDLLDPRQTLAPNGADEVVFSRGPARRPRPAAPLLQWATGLQTTDRRLYAGWLVEAGRLDTLDAAMERAECSRITIRHGSGKLVTHWAIETASLFVICEGVQSIAEMKQTAERYGIAFGWRRLEDGRAQSQLRCRVLVRELLAVGYHEPLLLSLKSTLTGDLITALMRQYDVLDALARFRAEAKKPPIALPFYACSIPLGPGQEVARGREQTKEITPVVAKVPDPVTREHCLIHWTKREWVALVEGLLDEAVIWSVQESLRIAAGEEMAGYEE